MTSNHAGWHRADIIAALHKRGQNLTSLARANGYGDSTLRASLCYPAKTPNRIIAEFLGEGLHAIWPDWYAPDGTQLITTREAIRRSRARRVQKAAPDRQQAASALTAEGAA
ncbi:MAG: helix-turn-helix domain-containing protein [Rhodobiaceae bacterium]|nr:helix-turn-helix domain-containing protein [Rhodobiaceae bacterium]